MISQGVDGMQEKLDLERAWNRATALISANRDVILVVAGVFFFLPNVISTLLLPSGESLAMQMDAQGDQPDPAEMMALFVDYFGQSWWIYLLLGLVQAVGVLGLLALLTDRSRPTVGEALGFGAKALLPYIIAQLLIGLALMLAPILLIFLGAAVNPGVAVILGFVGLILAIYLWVKFSLLSPVIAIDRIMNPVAALRRSWRLTKGNSLRLFALYFLLIIAVFVLSLVASMVFALFTVLGETIGLFAAAIGGGLISMAFTTVMLAVLAAVHRQLSGGTAESARETFE
ncbi:hypothetical protein [Aurantiacibacter hainanensis]|uniref:hypothetical protein n=1 Tax=Aurantiacibacter hainanensis TaxID=3076114 RepID=UPI0030C749F6